MPFETGNSSSIDNFISQMLSFAVANAGFTMGTTVQTSAGSGAQNVRSVIKGGVRWSFFYDPYGNVTTDNGIAGFMSYAQANSGVNVSGNLNSKLGEDFCSDGMVGLAWGRLYGFNGPYPNHWFFTDGVSVHAVLEITTGLFAHINFGSVTKYGSWTGGEFIGISGAMTTNDFSNAGNTCTPFGAGPSGNYPAGSQQYAGKIFMRVNNAGVSADFARQGDQSYGYNSTSGYFSAGPTGNFDKTLMADLLNQIPSASAWRTLLTPIIWFRANGSGRVYPAAHVPNVTFTRMTDVMVNGQLIETDWRIFPIFRRATTSGGLPYSSNWAIAYREVA